ncbi:related to aminotriazole resistance protein [Fusarium oxysporum]|uniref:Related to aminotriazole resistance protein n=1 Tax=Fusarium oxysporum TaxID=5507 RepID=A0A2H3TUR3_FUSOX|nr:related to aminotriazole resistance protein [Fusarium oxysporum]
MRALQGVAIAMHFSSSVALVADTQPRGQSRNMSFACLGLSQLLGFTFGLVIGGVLVDTVGWRSGWYLYGGATLLLSAVGLWALPKSEPLGFRNTFGDLISRVDWIGALLASASMASLSYFLAVISTDVHRIKETGTIILLCFSLATLPLFVGWMHYRVRRSMPALIPNCFWSNSAFATICIAVALSFAVLNSLDLLTSLYFQEIQYLSAVEAAIRILPSTVVGLGLNLMTGLIVHKIPAVWLVFPEKNQSLAGAVFNTAAQFGNALGLAIVQVVSAGVTNRNINPKSPEARLEGYRASFWTLFALMLVCVLVAALGLRRAGKVGSKGD